MSNLGETFNAGDLPPTQDFTPLPAGIYTVTVADATLNDTKAGTGQYIKLRLDVTGPAHEGRVLFANLNIRNPSSEAEEIGRRQLGEVMRSIGLADISDTDQLVGGSMAVKVKVTHSDEYGDGNDVVSYRAIEGSKPPQPKATNGQAAQPAPAPAQASSGGSRAPWAK